jgi:hypothetical protein
MERQLEAMRATVSKAKVFRKVFIPVNPGRRQKENGHVTPLSPDKPHHCTFFAPCAPFWRIGPNGVTQIKV